MGAQSGREVEERMNEIDQMDENIDKAVLSHMRHAGEVSYLYADWSWGRAAWQDISSKLLPGRSALDGDAALLLQQAAGFLAACSYFDVENRWDLDEFLQRGILRSDEFSVLEMAMGVAAGLSRGLPMRTEAPAGVDTDTWLRVSYVAAEWACTWMWCCDEGERLDDVMPWLG